MASKSNSKGAAEQPVVEQSAAEQPTQEQPAAAPLADEAAPEAAAEAAAEEQVETEAAEPEQSLEDACAELGIEPDAQGNASVELLVSLAGEQVKAPGDEHECAADEAVRLVRAGFAKPRS